MLRQLEILITWWAVLWDSQRARSTERLIINTSHSIGCFIIITVTFAPSILGGHLRRLEIVIYVRLGLILRCSDNLVILTTWAVLWACWGSARSAERLINDTPTALAVSSSSLSPPLHHPSLVVVFGGDWSWDAQTTWWFWLLELYCEMSRGAFLRKTHQWHKLPQPRPFHHHHHRHLCTLHPWWSPSGIRDFHEVHRHMCVNWSAGDRLIEYYQLDWQRQGHVFLDWWQ